MPWRVHVISLLARPLDLLNAVAPPFPGNKSLRLLFSRPFVRHASQNIDHLLGPEMTRWFSRNGKTTRGSERDVE